MTQPFFPCTISAQSRNNEFLTIKNVVRKTHQNNGHTGSSCLDKAVLAQGGGGTIQHNTLHSFIYLHWILKIYKKKVRCIDVAACL